jgi:outer membrane protein assembly factor BamB
MLVARSKWWLLAVSSAAALLALAGGIPAVSRAQPAASVWPMYAHDAMHTCLSTVDTSANPGTQKWSFSVARVGGPLGGDSLASPAIGPDGTIYIGTRDGRLFAVATNGKKEWVFKVHGSKSQTPADNPQASAPRRRRNLFANAIYYPPAIGADGTIYVGDYNGNVYALTPRGKLKWSLTLDSVVADPLTIGGDGIIYVPTITSLYALIDGGTAASVKWSFDAGSGANVTSAGIAPDGTVYFGSSNYSGSDNGNLYALNRDGTEVWVFATSGPIAISPPAIGADGTIYVGSDDTNLYAVNPDGTERWTFSTGAAVESTPAIAADGTIYVGGPYQLFALTDGGQGSVTEKWAVDTNPLGFSAPAIGADGTIYVGANSANRTGTLWAVNPDGSVRWKFVGRGGFADFSPAIGPDGTIYTTSGNYDGRGMLNLYAVGAKAPRRGR